MPRNAQRQQARPLQRNIYFYRTNIGYNGAGRPVPFDAAPVIQAISQILPAQRYLQNERNELLYCWGDRQTGPQRMRIAYIRRDDLPSVETGGRLAPLDIPAGAGLAEQTHIVFFPNNLVGVEFNFYGPRAGRLAQYIGTKLRGIYERIQFDVLVRSDVQNQMANWNGLSLFRLKIRESYIRVVSEANRDLGQAFEAAHRASNAGEVEIVLRPTAYSRGAIDRALLRSADWLLRRADLREEAKIFEVKGFNPELHRIESVDLLSDQIVLKKQILRMNPRSRAVNSDSAYDAIEAAYAELRVELEASAALLV